MTERTDAPLNEEIAQAFRKAAGDAHLPVVVTVAPEWLRIAAAALSETAPQSADWDSPLDHKRLELGKPCYRCGKVISAPLSHLCDLKKKPKPPSATLPPDLIASVNYAIEKRGGEDYVQITLDAAIRIVGRADGGRKE